MKFLIEVDTDIETQELSELIEKLVQITLETPGEALDVLLGTVVAVAIKNLDLSEREELVADVQDALGETFEEAFAELDRLDGVEQEAPGRTLN